MQKQLFFYFIGILVTVLVASCGEPTTSEGEEPKDENANTNTELSLNTEEELSQNGFAYIHHIKNEGPKTQPGSYAYFDFEIYGVTESSRAVFYMGDSQFRKVSAPDEIEGFVNPFLDVLPLMAIGDSLTVKQMPESIGNLEPGYEEVVYFNFQIKLTDIKTPEEHNKLQVEKFNKKKAAVIEAQANLEALTAFSEKTLADYKAGKLKDQLVEKPSGVKYMIHEEGKGKDLKKGNIANVLQFSIMVLDGTVFENTFQSGAMKSVQIGKGNNMQGLEEVLEDLKRGAKVSIFIPHELTMDKAGTLPVVPGNSEVMLYVELTE